MASKQVDEYSCDFQNTEFAYGEVHEHETSHEEGPDAKRRRLSSKTTNPPGYPLPAEFLPVIDPGEPVAPPSASTSEDPISELLTKALHIAPRVGKTTIEHGELFDLFQKTFSDYHIRVIELCKGTDRFRKPPVKLMPSEAPWRLSLGIHRGHLTQMDLGSWQQWEQLSNRKMCAKFPPLRLLVTVFARKLQNDGAKRNLEHDMNLDEPIPKQARLEVGHAPVEPHTASVPVPVETPKEATQGLGNPSIAHASHGPKFRSLPKETQMWISKIHHNLGHPSWQKLQKRASSTKL